MRLIGSTADGRRVRSPGRRAAAGVAAGAFAITAVSLVIAVLKRVVDPRR